MPIQVLSATAISTTAIMGLLYSNPVLLMFFMDSI